MTPQGVEALFTRADGNYLFARWGRPIAPVVFGVDDVTLATVKGACEAVVALAGHEMAESDPELGVNLMLFFLRDWSELAETPDLDRLLPDLGSLVDRLKTAGANQYRLFRYDAAGAIKAAFVFVRMDATLSALPAEAVALDQAVRVILLWSERAFMSDGPLVPAPDGRLVLRPEIADVIRVGYDPVMPAMSRDVAHALRLAARMGTEG
ncbi:hypothetical protein EV663_10290 [Rhodovulum bhavnagarense]|uniref:Uncharacterized protein n=1 Tax=Rhodovulum bhavnagarense TaxID=992286 RepID=A0A4V2SWG9_9RHOB|nr:hypothetical protein [Rhodovulum bhavnagarense]TCP62246.1 hypothetical protein EV663_10290 [Rhodovulum bhavnagarense]